MKIQDGVRLQLVAPQSEKSIFTWDEFQGSAFPRYAAALDGFVYGPPAINHEKPCINFNHHELVVRFATRATCEQVKVALDMGLFDELLRSNGAPRAHVFANDRDQDVCLSWYQLSRYPNLNGPLLTRLINMQGLLDMSAGSYPIHPDAPILREFAWIFEPYVQARMANRLSTETPDEMRAGIDEVCERLDRYMLGRGEQINLDTDYDVLREGTGWKMVQMRGYYARLKMRKDGILMYINYRGQLSSGAHIYSVGREPFVNANLPQLFRAYSEAEPDQREWGGGDTIGASPRGLGSTLDPNRIFEIMESYIQGIRTNQ